MTIWAIKYHALLQIVSKIIILFVNVSHEFELNITRSHDALGWVQTLKIVSISVDWIVIEWRENWIGFFKWRKSPGFLTSFFFFKTLTFFSFLYHFHETCLHTHPTPPPLHNPTRISNIVSLDFSPCNVLSNVSNRSSNVYAQQRIQRTVMREMRIDDEYSRRVDEDFKGWLRRRFSSKS